MNSGMIAENIFSAIDVIVDKKLREAKYDSTIIAKIIKVQDSALGRYEVQYQDAKFTALSVGGGAYQINDNVYVLVPTNDLSRDKYILGLGNSNRRITALGDIVTTAQLEAIIKRIEELEGQPSLDNYAKKSDLENYATKDQLNNLALGDKVTVTIPQEETNTETIATIKVNETSYAIKAPKAVEAGSTVTYQGTNAADGDTIGTLTIDDISYDIKAPSLAGYAKTDDIPDVTDYATQTWVQNTALQGYAKTDDIPDLNGYATEDWVNQQGYITTIPSDDLSAIEGSNPSNGVILQLESGNSTDQVTIVGTGAATVQYKNSRIEINAPQSTSDGTADTVSYSSNVSSDNGVQIGTLTVGDIKTQVYAPKDKDTEYGLGWSSQSQMLTLIKGGTSLVAAIPYATNAESATNASKLGDIAANLYALKADIPSVDTYIDNNELMTALKGYQLKLTPGDNIEISEPDSNNKVTINATTYSLPEASGSILGGVYGTALEDLNGYTQAQVVEGKIYYKDLPIATETSLGGVKIGSNINVTDEGAIYVPIAGVENASIGVVKTNFDGGGEPEGTCIAQVSGGDIYYKDTTYKAATEDTLGLVKTGYSESTSIDNRNYAVQLDDYGNMYVNVPWTVGQGADGNNYHIPTYNAGLEIATGSGVNNLYVPFATTETSGLISGNEKEKIDKLPYTLTVGTGENQKKICLQSSQGGVIGNYITVPFAKTVESFPVANRTDMPGGVYAYGTGGDNLTQAQVIEGNVYYKDTTYELGVNENNITLTPQGGTSQAIIVPYATKAGSAESANTANNATSLGGKVANDYALKSSLEEYVTTNGLSSTLANYVLLANVKGKGSTNQPVYFNANGAPNAISYTIEKSVPADAEFVHTGYTSLTDDGPDYPVKLDSNNKMFVEVPWTDTTYSNATTTTAGLMSTNDKIKLDSINLTNYISFDNLQGGNTQTFQGAAETITKTATSKIYPVAGDNNGDLAVYVPWTDTGVTSVEVTGTGNVVTAASYDSKNRKLTLKKEATYATKGELATLQQTATQAGEQANSAYNMADGAIQAANNAVGFAEDALTKANQNVENITGLGDRVSAIEGRESSYLTESSANNKYATKQDFQGYQQAVDNIGSQAGTAKSTADTALSKANTALSKADTATATANTAQQTATQFSNRLSTAEGAITGLQSAGYITKKEVEANYVKNNDTYQALTSSVATHDQKISDLQTNQSNFQPKLIAGSGININNNNTISISAAAHNVLGGVYSNYDASTIEPTGSKAMVYNGYIYYTDTNTHYVSHLYVNDGQDSNSKQHTSSTNGNTNLCLQESTSQRSKIKIQGTGGTTVSSNDSGVITIDTPITTYILPIATETSLGGVKIGNNLSKGADGTISVSTGGLNTFGVVQSGPYSEWQGGGPPQNYGFKQSPIANGIVYYKDTQYKGATSTSDGLMSSSDKSKLNDLPQSLSMSYSDGTLTITYTDN